ncbi:hypothetical protein GMORB2_4379 [Geosmithia morbida]|uniref:Uncharacterized protein n=1 Tax=Geosmithia morbida TaxID=1094350 RepID=A0A9P4YQ77_9HYPO|nr:uncharacterized protein GMORB2_4379 [Geosmithia morbida]KAF4119713.1 hypothetical protein GMORB2_4379 [Geosmithia morbida]
MYSSFSPSGIPSLVKTPTVLPQHALPTAASTLTRYKKYCTGERHTGHGLSCSARSSRNCVLGVELEVWRTFTYWRARTTKSQHSGINCPPAACNDGWGHQDLDGYVQCIHGLNFSLRRLAPPQPKSRPQTLSEGEESRVTTSGRTSIVGKYYPHTMRLWSEFDDIYRQSFSRIQAALSDKRVFPSVINMRALAEQIQIRLPLEFLGSEAFLNEMKTSQFIHDTLQMPVQRIINAYLEACGQQKKVFFDNYTSGWGKGSAQTSAMSEDGGEPGTQAAARPPPKTQPDCYVLATNAIALPAGIGGPDDDVDATHHSFIGDILADGSSHNVYRISLSEHKAFHRLRTTAVASYAIPEDYMVQLARVASRQATGTEQEDAVRQAERGAPGQVFYARALTQAFHYMASSGVEFGYMATGETLTFLRYVAEAGDDRQLSDDERARLAVSMLSAITLMALETAPSQVRQRDFNLSQLTHFPQLPASSTAASSPGGSSVSRKRRRRDDSDQDSADDDSSRDDGDDDDARSTSSNLGMPARGRRRHSSPLKKQWNMSDADDGQKRAGAKRKRGGDQPTQPQRPGKSGLRRWDVKGNKPTKPTRPNWRDPSTFRPIRPFCTQGCLRGLIHGEEMDASCPNLLLHIQAAQRDSRSWRPSIKHPLTPDELRELVQLQLLSNAEQDCDCLLSRGLAGAIGCLFKITATGYGYTFVAKGVEEWNSYRLLREVGVYEGLVEQQGSTIPVCLGLVPLLLPYPMDNGALVTHMLLMSFAGLGLHARSTQWLAKKGHVDLERESERTLQELRAHGLVDRDDVSNGNLTWNRELQRVMKIDFDHASINRPEALGLVSKASPATSLGSSRYSRVLLPGRMKARLPSDRRAWDDGERDRGPSKLLRNARRSDAFIASLLIDASM